MADHLDHSSTSNDASADSKAEENSQDNKLHFSEDEEFLITRMYNLVGERWSLIAGRIPGRTAEEIEKYWNTRYSTSQ
uniref:MYB domain containing protein enhancer of TRY and CPC 1a n=1 Tax=Catharanthus roseus TaxID=4058 RepID=A0A2U9IY30_CATRO|nr:MYB domain containing protein enhancer of TRY and CPC 1a [Catharanthus roseus]